MVSRMHGRARFSSKCKACTSNDISRKSIFWDLSFTEKSKWLQTNLIFPSPQKWIFILTQSIHLRSKIVKKRTSLITQSFPCAANSIPFECQPQMMQCQSLYEIVLLPGFAHKKRFNLVHHSGSLNRTDSFKTLSFCVQSFPKHSFSAWMDTRPSKRKQKETEETLMSNALTFG